MFSPHTHTHTHTEIYSLTHTKMESELDRWTNNIPDHTLSLQH